MQEENILTTWQTPVSVRVLIGWLQVRGCRFKSWIFSFFTYFSNMFFAVQLRVLGLMAYWYTGSAFHQIPQSYLNHIYSNRTHIFQELLIDHSQNILEFLWVDLQNYQHLQLDVINLQCSSCKQKLSKVNSGEKWLSGLNNKSLW